MEGQYSITKERRIIGCGDHILDRMHALDVAAEDPDGDMPPWVMRHLVNTVKEVRNVAFANQG